MSEPRRALTVPTRWGARLATIGVAALAIAILLVAYTVTNRPASGGPAGSSDPTRATSPTSTSSPTRPAAPSPSASSSPAGPQMILDENFDEPILDESIWNTCHWWNDEGCTISSNDELEWYRPEQVSVRDGALQLTADRNPIDASDGKTYEFRSGMVTTGPPEDETDAKVAFTYGSVEARIRLPRGQGLWSAMWMLPADGESRPEIDILESIGSTPDEMIMHLHPRNRAEDSPDRRHRLANTTASGGWHTIRLDWSLGKLRFFADGAEVWRVTGNQVPDEPMYLVFNLAVGGVYPGPPDDSTRFPATYALDYVRVSAAP